VEPPDNSPRTVGTAAAQQNPTGVQILAAEHWSLLATRGLIWNEIFTRATMFFTLVSAAVVGLALMAQATEYGDDFTLFALVLLPVVLFVGVATYVRVLEANLYNLTLEASMNRLRRGYLDIAPGLEMYFTTSASDDVAGIMQSAGITNSGMVGLLWSTPFLICVVNGMIAGVLGAIAAETLGASQAIYIGAGVAAGVLLIVLFFVHGSRRYKALVQTYVPRFPASPNTPFRR
jgi:hypothetical protein